MEKDTLELVVTVLAILLTSDTVVGLIPDRFVKYIGIIRTIAKKVREKKETSGDQK